MNYKELNNAYKRINTWYGKKTKVLSIKTRPYNSYIIFSNVIDKILSSNGKILYIWCNSEVNNTKKQAEYIDVLFTQQERKVYANQIKFISVKQIKDTVDEYDLVIFDDITMFSQISSDKLREAVEEVYWRSKKIIIYSCEKVFPIGERLELVYLLNNKPMIEPRYITTRIKLEEDIPMALFEYYRWFKLNKRKVLVIVPSEDKLNKLYNNYYKLLKEEDIRVIKFHRDQNLNCIREILEENNDSIFIITNNIGQYISEIDDVNVVILFSDDDTYYYKKLIYTCGALNTNSKIVPEMILASREISSDMDKAKNMTRGFNKKLWERRLQRV